MFYLIVIGALWISWWWWWWWWWWWRERFGWP